MAPSAGFAVLPTVGGQTALNLAVDLAEAACWRSTASTDRREAGGHQEGRRPAAVQGRDAGSGSTCRESALVNNHDDGIEFAGKIGFPVVIRPSFTLGGSGGGIAYNREEMTEILSRGLDLSPVRECLH